MLQPELNTQFIDIISLIKLSQNRAIKAVNQELIELYWAIGQNISSKIGTSLWGAGVVKQLADYIIHTDPSLKGFSDKNLWRMKQFYETYQGSQKLSPLVRQISWTNNLVILSRTKSSEEREFYLKKCISEHFSKRELERQISCSLYERTLLGNAKLSPVAREMYPDITDSFKDNYVFEFLGLPQNYSESELQKGLVSQMKNFVIELGKDFLFVGQEFRVQVGASDFYIDLLFYHRGLQCLVAFELKAEKFKPEHIGQLNFYLEALDRDVKKKNENPSIGILLCKDRDNEVVEYSLSRSLSPTLVAQYQMQLPDKEVLQNKLRQLF